MSVKIEMPSSEASILRDEWEQKMYQLRGQADELEKAIASIDAQLNRQSVPFGPVQNIAKSGKRKKGENLRTIQTALSKIPQGASTAEISQITGLSISSCTAVLKRHDDIFARGNNDGLWRCKPKG